MLQPLDAAGRARLPALLPRLIDANNGVSRAVRGPSLMERAA